MNLADEPYQYLYSEGDQVHLLNLETFEEIEMVASKCEGGDRSVGMLEGMCICVFVHHQHFLLTSLYRFYAYFC